MVKKVIPVKADLRFHKMLQDIQRERMISRLDKKLTSMTRLTLAISRHEKLKEDLLKADLIDDRRGQIQFSVFNIFLIMIIAFVAVIMLGGYIYISGILADTFHDVGLTNEANSGNAGYVNLTEAADDTFGQMNSSAQSLRLVALCLILAEMLSFIFMNGLVKIHPMFFFPYILIVILAVIFSATISNSYEALLVAGTYDGLLASFTGSNWLLLNLPLVIGIIGVLGGVFMFINIITPGNQGSLS